MKTTKRNIAIFTAALTALAFTSVGPVSAEETTKSAIRDTKEVRASTTANKNFHNRRGFYDRENDVWVYRVR